MKLNKLLSPLGSIALFCMALGTPLLPAQTPAAKPARDITFLHISDLHYGVMNFDRPLLQHTIDAMNALPGVPYPAALGGNVATVSGVILTGDLTNDGMAAEFPDFAADWGLTGKDGRLKFPLYEGVGNHDGAPSCTKNPDLGAVRRLIIQRNITRVGLVNKSSNGLHYSWDWQDVHFVCLNESAGVENDKRYPGNPAYNRKKQDYCNPPEMSLQFLAQDLAAKVGTSGRPVVLAQHFGFDGFVFHPWGDKAAWWTEEQAMRLWEVCEGYNIIAILSGHDGSEAAFDWNGILNQHLDDNVKFGVYRIAGDKLTIAERDSRQGTWGTTSQHPVNANRSLPPELLQGPYMIYPNNPAQMTVAWRCKSNVPCTIKWGTDQFIYELGKQEVSPVDARDHLYRVDLTDLPADASVKFDVEINGRHAPGMFYTPPASTAAKVKFLVVGGTPESAAAMAPLNQAVYDKIYEDAALHTFLLHPGGLVPAGATLDQWDALPFSRDTQARHGRYLLSRLPIMSAVAPATAANPLAAKILPYSNNIGAAYAFDYGPAHVVVLDPSQSCAAGSPQLAWLKQDLESSKSQWKFLVLPQPAWSAGSALGSAELQQSVQPLGEAYGVDICFSAEDGLYAHGVVGGVQYITTGGAGRAAQVPAGQAKAPFSVIKAGQHFCTVTIEADTLTLQAIQPNGTVVDSFTMKDFKGTGK
ncbi:MAG: metallophosphoesterase [Verrucomicrobia bacterium]|nr:metallophosphoesterase [Verrucomicrobiota bacterium]